MSRKLIQLGFLPFVAVVAFGAPGLCTAALAQKASDGTVVAACLKKTSDAGEFGASCIGSVADPCITESMAKKTYWEDSKACASRELTVWTELMARSLKTVDKAGDKKIKDAVIEAQKAWQQSREKLCPIFDGLDPGMVPGGANYCRLQETARRVLSLQRLGAALGEH
jgi:uncharacterized protein YecT (DUF1311 family)